MLWRDGGNYSRHAGIVLKQVETKQKTEVFSHFGFLFIRAAVSDAVGDIAAGLAIFLKETRIDIIQH